MTVRSLDDIAAAAAPPRRRDTERLVVWGLTLAVFIPILLFLVQPLVAILGRSLATPDGLGLGNFAEVMGSRRFRTLVGNTVASAAVSTVLAVTLGYAYAYVLQRCTVRGKAALRLIALLPLFAPSLVQAQGLILLLGRNGILNRQLGIGIDIYGFWGVAIANLLYVFPYVLLILSAALAVGDQRLYDSARMLGAGPWRIFRDVTLPSTRFGLAAAVFVAFTLVITDFGNPVVIGGDFNVLATEVYNQVIGQAQFERGAVIGVCLLVPAALAKIVEKRLTRRQYALVSAHSRPLEVVPGGRRDAIAALFAWMVAGVFLAVVGIVVLASFVKLWPYNMTFTLQHYQFDVQNGIGPLWNSIAVSLASAALGVAASVLAALAVYKFRTVLTGPLSFLAVLPSAVPGMVLGLGYILTFNDAANPLNALYGTLAIIVILNVYYNHSHGFLVASTSLKQISDGFDEAAATLGAGMGRILRTITLPLLWQTLLGVAVFYFMRAMVSLSAVIFLITPSTQVASVSVLHLSDRGAVNQAAAFSVCIMAVVLGMMLAVRLVLRLAGVRGVTLIR